MKEIEEVLTFLSRIYPGGAKPSELSAAWLTAAPDMAPEVMREAAIEYVRTAGNRFHPTPGDLLAIAAKYGDAARPTWEQARKRVAGLSADKIERGLFQLIQMFGESRFREAGDTPDRFDLAHWDRTCRRHAQLAYVRKRELERNGETPDNERKRLEAREK